MEIKRLVRMLNAQKKVIGFLEGFLMKREKGENGKESKKKISLLKKIIHTS